MSRVRVLQGAIYKQNKGLQNMNNTVDAIKTYFKGVKTEWGKVSWPERRQVIFETFSVIVIVFVFTVAIYLMDLLFKGLLSLIK